MLLGDPSFSSFTKGLALGRGFQLGVIFGDAEGTAAALLLIEKQVTALRRGPVERVVLHEGALQREGVEGEAQNRAAVAVLLGLLLAPPMPREDGAAPLYVLNATTAARGDAALWIELFEGMNQLRNDMMRTLPGPLLLCLPADGLPRFAQAAPDLWSIRGAVLSLPGERAVTTTARPVRLLLVAAAEDADLFGEFLAALAPFEQQGLVDAWSERLAHPGELLDVEVARRLASADSVLFFLSPALLGTPRYVQLIENARALGKRCVPVQLRPVAYNETLLGELQPLPGYEWVSPHPRETRSEIWQRCIRELVPAYRRLP